MNTVGPFIIKMFTEKCHLKKITQNLFRPFQKGIKASIQCIFSSFTPKSGSSIQHGHQSARTEISPVIGPVDPQHHPTDQYIGVQCGIEFAAIIRENQASLVELHW